MRLGFKIAKSLCTVKVSREISYFRIGHNYLHANKLIYEKQSGFLTGHSTVFQLIDIYHNIIHSLDNKLNISLVWSSVTFPKHLTASNTEALSFKLNQNGSRVLFLFG